MSSFVQKIILPLFLFFGFGMLYIHNLSRSVYGGDVGDLVTAAGVGGVAHPPGYPLFTFLGFLLTHIPFLLQPAFAVGLISSLAASAGIACFYGITYTLTKNKIVSFIASCILGFSFLYWFYAEIAEVFAFNAFFALVLLLLALVYRKNKKTSFVLAFFLFLGLSFTHHQTIILVVPSLFLLIGKTFFQQIRKYPRYVLWSLLFFLTGLTPYLYIFIASSHNPVINWDSVHDLNSFFHLIFRRDYGTFQAGIFDTPSLGQRLVTLKVYLEYIIFQLTIPTVLLVLVGFWKLFKHDKALFFALSFAWIVSGPVFLLYAGFPLTSGFILGAYERFALLSFVIFLIPFGMGLLTFSHFLSSFLPKRNYARIFQLVFLFIPIALFFYNFPKTNLSTVMLGDTYAKDYLEVLPRNSVLIISGDTQIFNIWYVHYLLHVRPDILVYNIGAATTNDPIISPKLSTVPNKQKVQALIAILKNVEKTRPIFSSLQLQPKNGDKITWMPYGLSYRMFQKGEQLPTKDAYTILSESLWAKLHVPTKQEMQSEAYHNLTIAEIPTYYSDSLVAAGTFAYIQYQDTDTALTLYEKARDVSPNNPHVYNNLGVLYMGISGKCNETVANLSESLTLDEFQEFPYFILYTTYRNCFKDDKAARSVSKQYTAIFQKNFQKELKKSENQLSLPNQ